MDTKKQELKDRVNAKAKRVEAKILELKADSSEAACKKPGQPPTELPEMTSHIKDGAAHLKDDTVEKLNAWLSKSL